MALIRKFRSESTNVEATKVCLNTGNVMLIKDMEMEVVKIRDTNYQLKESVRILNENNAKTRREAQQQQQIISSLKSLHEEIVKKKDEESREMKMQAAASSAVQDVMSKEELACTKNETAKLREEWRTKCEKVNLELEDLKKEICIYKTENMRLKTAHEDALGALEEVEKENKQLSGEAKGLEADLNNVQVKLNAANKQLAEYQNQVHDMKVTIDDEKRMREELRASMTSQDRRCNMLQQELNETRMALELAEQDRKELQQTVHLDSLFVKDLMAASSKIESEELERMRNVTEALESECDEAKCKLDQSETKLHIMKEDGERLLSELNSMKTTLLRSCVDRNNETKIMEDRLYSVKAERDIFKVLATASKRKQEEEERHSNEHIQRARRQNHREQVAYLHQAWQDAARSPRHVYDPNWPPENSINRTENDSCSDKDTVHVRDKT